MGNGATTVTFMTMRHTLFLAAFLFAGTACYAQQSKLTMTFTPAKDPGRVITANMASLIKNTYASNDYSCYWFINPHTNLHHLVIGFSNMAGVGPTFLSTAIELNSTENDFEFWDHPSPNSDSNFLAIDKAYYVVSAPVEYDRPSLGGTSNHNNPMKVHITTFTPSEIEFTISGNAEYGTKEGEDGKFLGYGAVEIQGHFYRQGTYEKSAVYPGCNCDPTIYAQRYDIEEGDARTASECEAIMLNKVFNAAKKALAPINDGAFKGSGKVPPGEVFIRLHNHADVSGEVPAKPEWPFVYDYKTVIARGSLAHIAYNNDDRFGIEMDEMPDDSKMNAVKENGNAAQANAMQTFQSMGLKEKQAKIDSLGQLMKDNKITLQQYSDQLQKIMAPANAAMEAGIKKGQDISAAGPDFKQMNMESMMHIQIDINPIADYYVPIDDRIKAGDVQVLHTVAGAAYVIRAPAVKNGDGEWLGNKCIVLLGKFKQPTVHGHDNYYTNAVIAPAVYPAAPNKLLIYNVAIQMTGGKDQIEKALATLDFSAFEQLLSAQ